MEEGERDDDDDPNISLFSIFSFSASSLYFLFPLHFSLSAELFGKEQRVENTTRAEKGIDVHP